MRIQALRPLPKAYPLELKSLGDHLRKRRLDLALRQKDLAERLGVDKTTVYNWERNRTTPGFRHQERLVQFLATGT